MEKKEIQVRDTREILKLLKEHKPVVSYYTIHQNSDGYSQTNEENVSLIKTTYNVGDSEEDLEGEYDKSKSVYLDDVYTYIEKKLKLDWFIEVLDDYIKLKGEESNNWDFETFFGWFEDSNGDTSEKKPDYFELHDFDFSFEKYEEFFEEDKFVYFFGYELKKNHDITWCSLGTNNYIYYGISINKIETKNEIITFDLSHDMSF